MLVPVVDVSQKPLQPCNRKRAYRLIRKRKATPFYRKGIFCIRLNKKIGEVSDARIIIGIDPGSKRTGITVLNKKGVILNLQVTTPYWVKDNVKAKREYRRSRRYRNTPYRKLRFNRSIGNIPPSTKARWNVYLRVLNQLLKIIPITHLTIEDIQAKTFKGKNNKWNKSFSPLQVGKQWFEDNLPDLIFSKFKGYETAKHRDLRNFKKTSEKLSNKWEAHCVDSHSLCELSSGLRITPDKSLYMLDLLKFNRRNLHQGYQKGGFRRNYGGTRSLGLSRGALVNHPKWKLSYLGGSSKGRVTLHNVGTGKRLCRNAKISDLKILTQLKWRTAFLPSLKEGVPCRDN